MGHANIKTTMRYAHLMPNALVGAIETLDEPDPNETGTQIGVATTSMLTLIAYRFMVGGITPTVPYLTRMDFFILGSTALVFVALIQAVVTSVMATKGNIRAARRVDSYFRAIGPATFVIIFVWSLII